MKSEESFNMKNNRNKDQGLLQALQHRNEAVERMTLSDDFENRLMKRIEQQERKPRRRRVWLYSAFGAVAASLLLLLAFHHYNNEEIKQQPVVAKQKELRDSKVTAKEKEVKPMIAQEKPVLAKTIVANQRPKPSTEVHETSTAIPTTDSLDYYIDKIERELAQVDESLYIERMNKVIRADERLQRMVNSYILHTLDKEGRPQTAENMYNVKSEQDEE